ncbi:MAG: hypothetical protein NC412_14895 [Roseburia sp.]|nr:hypothetical protein [Roseburia sp.]MCM1279596.1 hypothetical protein [Robinsoniella sp.]
MKNRILSYMEYVDKVLEKNETGLSYEEIMQEHLTQIQFFSHERLIHLLVTITFAILTFGTFFLLVLSFSPGLVCLLAALFILLVPYIMHYYLLENGVQKMYRQYDELLKHMRSGK